MLFCEKVRSLRVHGESAQRNLAMSLGLDVSYTAKLIVQNCTSAITHEKVHPQKLADAFEGDTDGPLLLAVVS